MCGVGEQMRKKQQRLLKNMDAHKVMLDLLQIPYDKVPAVTSSLTWHPRRLHPVPQSAPHHDPRIQSLYHLNFWPFSLSL